MPVERLALILRVDPAAAWVSPLGACSGCIGCSGRCDGVFSAASDAGLRLPRAVFEQAPVPGQRVRLVWEAPALLGVAARAYGWPLLGLLVGAVLPAWLNRGARLVDLGVLLGALAGTLLGVALSKRALAVARDLRVLPAVPDSAADAATHR